MSENNLDMREHLQKLEFLSEGYKIVGNLVKPAAFKGGDVLSAIVMVGLMTRVKEPAAGLWAKHLANAGLITLVFDHRNLVECGGSSSQHEDPANKIEGLTNTLSFLGSLQADKATRKGLI